MASCVVDQCLFFTGGLGLTQNEIGVSLTIIGAMMLPLMLFLFPLVNSAH